MAGFDEATILGLGKTPIPGDAPCGVDVADDEDFLLLEAEMVKVDRIDLGDPDWYRIEDASLNLLRAKSKDLSAACALGYALFKKHRYAGLAAVLGMIAELTGSFWDNLFPQRPRRRKALIESLTERLVEGGWFRDAPPKPDEFDAVDRCVERIAALQTALTAKMPDDPPDFAKFVRKVKELAGSRPKPAAAAAPATAAAAAPSAGAGAFTAGDVQDVSGALNAVLSAATFLRKADAADPLPYALVRLIKWARIELPATDEAQHRIEPPEKSLVEALVFQFSNGVWEHLHTNAEAAFRSSDPLWLDLQRYVCVAMQNLGSKFDKARAAVMNVTGGLVRRLGSGVYGLTFRDGMPLCSGETRMWLETEVLAAPGGGQARGGAGAADGRLTEASATARKLAGAGKLSEAIKALQDGLAACAQRRDRLLWRLQIAQVCCDMKRLQLAGPLLEECYDEIRRYHIEEWEPTLAVEVAQTLYQCRKALLGADKEPLPGALDRVRESFAWLCQLDPLAALAAEPAGK
jgi:type VI secretion system ImpA/VasJ family protein